MNGGIIETGTLTLTIPLSSAPPLGYLADSGGREAAIFLCLAEETKGGEV